MGSQRGRHDWATVTHSCGQRHSRDVIKWERLSWIIWVGLMNCKGLSKKEGRWEEWRDDTRKWILHSEHPKGTSPADTFTLVTGNDFGTPLVMHWIRICLSMQGLQVSSLVREDTTCREASKPMCHNYWAHVPRMSAPKPERPPQWEARSLKLQSSLCSPQLEKAHVQQRSPSVAKEIVKLIKFKKENDFGLLTSRTVRE